MEPREARLVWLLNPTKNEDKRPASGLYNVQGTGRISGAGRRQRPGGVPPETAWGLLRYAGHYAVRGLGYRAGVAISTD